MARAIIVLNVEKRPDNATHLSGVFWLTAPASLVIPKPTFASAVPPVASVSWGISANEVAALQAGTVIEEAWDGGQIPSGTTLNQIETGLQNAFSAAQTRLNNTATAAKFIGAFWDGTTWTLPQ